MKEDRKAFILALGQRLIKRRNELRRTLAGELTQLKDSGVCDGDFVDVAAVSLQSDISSHIAEARSNELAQVERALQRMQDGKLGVCEECGREIPTSRLSAILCATMCFECQYAAEFAGTGLDVSRLMSESGGDIEGFISTE